MNRTTSVYLLEDEPAHAILLTYHIEKLGYTVTHFEDASTFLKQPTKVDCLVISDEFLDPKEACFLCSKLEPTHHPYHLIITGTGKLQSTCTNPHSISYLQKPFTIAEIKAQLAKLEKNKVST